MNPALQTFYAERRKSKIKFALYSLVAIIGMCAVMYAVWSIATYDFCWLYYKIKCF